MNEDEMRAHIFTELYSVWLKNWFDLNKVSSAWPSPSMRNKALASISKDVDAMMAQIKQNKNAASNHGYTVDSQDNTPF